MIRKALRQTGLKAKADDLTTFVTSTFWAA